MIQAMNSRTRLCSLENSLQQVLARLSPEERIGFFWILRGRSAAQLGQGATVPYFSILCRNITIIGKWMFTSQEMDAMARMVEAGIIKLGKQAGHENVGGGFKFEEWEQGLVEAEGAVEWGRHVMFMP